MLTTLRQRSRADYDVQTEQNVMVPMRDGAHLSADIYFPTQNGARLAQQMGGRVVGEADLRHSEIDRIGGDAFYPQLSGNVVVSGV